MSIFSKIKVVSKTVDVKGVSVKLIQQSALARITYCDFVHQMINSENTGSNVVSQVKIDTMLIATCVDSGVSFEDLYDELLNTPMSSDDFDKLVSAASELTKDLYEKKE